MKTISDIIDYVVNTSYGLNCTSCRECTKLNWCYLDTLLCALDYLYNSEY